jgi:type IV pilus biogenesis protein CpaD/CtpE
MIARILTAAFLATSLFACASDPPAQVTLTAADMVKPAAVAEAPAPKEAPPAIPAEAGDLVCRVTTKTEGNVELYLKWTNGSAKGVLRTVAPSGNVTTQNVGADSYQGLIVVDDVLSGDLVEHAAVVRNHDGKRSIRLNGTTWLTCQ